MPVYKNLGNWKFRDVTAEAGLDKIDFYTHGCAVADYDRDGWPDLVVTGYEAHGLFTMNPSTPLPKGEEVVRRNSST